MTCLITAATGNVGARVVDLLLARGERPRVFVRDVPKARARFGDRVDVHVGDLGDSDSLAAAFEGVGRVLLINAGPELGRRDEIAAQVATATGVTRLVKLSTMDVQQGVGTGPWHARGETAIRASGIGFTFVRPAGFMDNALAWASAITSSGVVRAATGAGKIAFIHSDDIAEVATAALTGNQYEGESLAISGPKALSYADMVATIGARIGRPLRFEPISDEQERRGWVERGESPASIDYHLSIFRAIRRGSLAGVTDTVARVLGRAPITFDQWVEQNVAAFRPGGS
jgi:uncharacterized protein YbjT (DUF2867 family)